MALLGSTPVSSEITLADKISSPSNFPLACLAPYQSTVSISLPISPPRLPSLWLSPLPLSPYPPVDWTVPCSHLTSASSHLPYPSSLPSYRVLIYRKNTLAISPLPMLVIFWFTDFTIYKMHPHKSISLQWWSIDWRSSPCCSPWPLPYRWRLPHGTTGPPIETTTTRPDTMTERGTARGRRKTTPLRDPLVSTVEGREYRLVENGRWEWPAIWKDTFNRVDRFCTIWHKISWFQVWLSISRGRQRKGIFLRPSWGWLYVLCVNEERANLKRARRWGESSQTKRERLWSIHNIPSSLVPICDPPSPPTRVTSRVSSAGGGAASALRADDNSDSVSGRIR